MSKGYIPKDRIEKIIIYLPKKKPPVPLYRPLRIQYAGAWYHVMNRGRKAEAVFLGKNDYINLF